jgi:hypothetical protein
MHETAVQLIDSHLNWIDRRRESCAKDISECEAQLTEARTKDAALMNDRASLVETRSALTA